MTFINTAVDLQSLPAAEDVALQPVHPAYKKVLRTEWAFTLLIFIALAIVCIVVFPFFRQPAGWIALTLGVALIGLFYYLWIENSFPFLAFAIREKDILLQSGWIVRTVKHCPFNRIQNCSVQSGPLERRFGLASLVIYTAGSGGADLRLRGLLQEDADRFRHFILETIHQEPDADN
ncbi:MAG: hypothetical protein EOO14_03700 [Chitinophagaceae bacterium]|nr:MAG: hypothetical protein EOO14_03700 [Chitinophagaceae bacterium]